MTFTHISEDNTWKVSDLHWIAGSWQTENAEYRTEEIWTDAIGNQMIGMGRTIQSGKTVFFEYLRIEQRENGIFYIAHPKASPGVEFKLTSLTKDEVVFENPVHDFPKRVIYQKKKNGIYARIEGELDGKPSSEEWNYHPKK